MSALGTVKNVAIDVEYVAKKVAHVVLDTVETLVLILLDRRQAARYCDAVSLPPLVAPSSNEWSATVEQLRRDFEAADDPAKYAGITDKVTRLIEGIAAALGPSAGPNPPTTEAILFKLMVPILLLVTQRSHKTVYVALVALVMIDQRLQDSLPDGTFTGRILKVLGGLADRAGWSGQQADGEASAHWAAITADAVVLAAALGQLKGKHSKPIFWHGLDLADPASGDPEVSAAHALLRRAATLTIAFDPPPFDFGEFTGATDGEKIGTQTEPGTPTLSITTMPVPAAVGRPEKLFVQLGAAADATVDLAGGWTFRYTNEGSASVLISRDGFTTLGNARLKAEVFQEYIVGDSEPRPTSGTQDETRAGLSIKFKRVGAGIQLDIDGPAAWLQLDQCDVAISGGHWLADHIPKLNFTFDAAIDATPGNGVALRGGVGGDAVFTVGKSVPLGLGKLRINTARLRVAARAEGDARVLQVAATTDLTLSLFGLLDISTNGLGAALSLGSNRQMQGNLAGVASAGLSLLAPTSAGLAINRSGLKGAGILNFDAANDAMFGGVELGFKGKFSFKGLGIYQSKKGARPSNWLLALSMTTAASPGGFVPKGGGLLYASDRGTNPEAFLAAVSTGDLEPILAPVDPVGNAVTYQAALDRLFPVSVGSQVFGLLVKFEAFGGKLHLDVGALLEWKNGDAQRAYIIASFSFIPLRRDATDPDERPVVVLAEGVALMDFTTGELNVRIALRNSHLWGGELTGEAMLFYGAPQRPGDSRAFFMSVGGFNPSYVPGPRLFVPKRLTVTLSKGDHLKLEMSAYLALTPQSFQLGFRSSIEAHLYGFGIRGRLEIDALVHFDFRIVIDIKISVELLLGSRTLAAVAFEGSLSVFKPTILAGSVKVKFLFWTLSKSGSLTIIGGSPEQVSVDVSALLEGAIKSPANWDFGGTTGFAAIERDRPGTWHDGLNGPVFRQNTVPFDVAIDRFAAATFSSPRTFRIEGVRDGRDSIAALPVAEEFPIGQYLDLADEQMLGVAMFEHWNAGFAMDLPFEPVDAVTTSLECEEFVRDPEAPPTKRPPNNFDDIVQLLSVFAVVKDEPKPIHVRGIEYMLLDNALTQRAAGLDLGQARAAAMAGDRIFAELSL